MVDVLLAVIIIIALVFGVAIGLVLGILWATKRKEAEIEDARRESVGKSRSTLSGQFLEKLAPHFPDFPHDPTEVRFIGSPVDYIVFCGLSKESVEEVVFLEVKSGKSSLSTSQRRVRDAVKAGKVRWEEYRPPEEEPSLPSPLRDAVDLDDKGSSGYGRGLR